MTDEKQSGKSVLLVVIILLLLGVVWVMATRISEQNKDVPGAQARR